MEGRLSIPDAVAPAPDAAIAAAGDALARQIDALLARGYRWLRFPSDIENRFLEDTDQPRRRHHTIMLVVALVFYDIFLIGDHQLIPDVFLFSVKVRLLLITPLGILAIIAVRYGSSQRLREFLITLSCTASGCSIVVFLLATHSRFASHYYMGLPLFVIFQNTVQRVRFWYGLAGSIAIVVVSALGLAQVAIIPPEVRQTFILVLLASCIFTLIALYHLEYEERSNYLFRLRDRLRQELEGRLLADLSTANQQLVELSRSDPLTGIANRRYFQEHLAQTWELALRDKTAVSLLILDVDYFKQYNDHYGHPAGDQCLRRVASAIKAALRKPADFVARYGGEEFVAVLPRTSPEQALGIAERVRQAVLGIDLPHDASQVAKIVTVSIGAASSVPAEPGQSPDDLIKMADQALYMAKANGRNRIWS